MAPVARAGVMDKPVAQGSRRQRGGRRQHAAARQARAAVSLSIVTSSFLCKLGAFASQGSDDVHGRAA